jgi:hypothetical protein
MCFKVEGGMAVVTVRDSTCYNLAGRVGDSSAFSATLTVSVTDPNAVVIRGGIGPRPSPPPYQPESVRAVLGERFERLTGPQVTERGDERVIVITRRYEWPDGRCAPTRGIFMPDQCPATSQQLQADNVHGAASEILAQLSQERLCEMWDLSLTPDAEQRHPYPEFIDEIDTWIQTLGDLGAGADDFALSRREIGSNGLRHEVELVLRGTPVARLVILELPDAPHAHDAGVTTFWGLDDYTLLPAPPA